MKDKVKNDWIRLNLATGSMFEKESLNTEIQVWAILQLSTFVVANKRRHCFSSHIQFVFSLKTQLRTNVDIDLRPCEKTKNRIPSIKINENCNFCGLELAEICNFCGLELAEICNFFSVTIGKTDFLDLKVLEKPILWPSILLEKPIIRIINYV